MVHCQIQKTFETRNKTGDVFAAHSLCLVMPLMAGRPAELKQRVSLPRCTTQPNRALPGTKQTH